MYANMKRYKKLLLQYNNSLIYLLICVCLRRDRVAGNLQIMICNLQKKPMAK